MNPNPIALQTFADGALSLQIRKCQPICPINLPEPFILTYEIFCLSPFLVRCWLLGGMFFYLPKRVV